MSYVVGTAGHVDHGKSTLIKALTGTDPDRLAEEKRRGMTIDLGFASLVLPSGRLAAIVDVPGHSRFVHNMLAGVHGLDAVLLVVAADEGVMPQTSEHLAIVELFGIQRAVVALTKVDLVDPEWRDLVGEEVKARLRGTGLATAPLVDVAAPAGTGVGEVAQALDRVLAAVPPRPDRGAPRLPVDRVFTIAGFGTVVTGTLVDGRVRVNDELVALPSGRRVRVRGLQQHNRAVDEALPGTRVALNLVGAEKDDLRRGDVIAAGGVPVTRRFDAAVTVLAGAPRLRHGARVTLHVGTAEVPARVAVLGRSAVAPAEAAFVQLTLGATVAAAVGDRFVLRLPSPSLTLGGGEILDAAPRRHRRDDPETVAALRRRQAGEVVAEELRKHHRGLHRSQLPPGATAPPEAVQAGEWLFAADAWNRLQERVVRVLDDYHRRHPLRPGMPRSEVRSRLGLGSALGPVLDVLASAGRVVLPDGGVALPDHRPDLGSAAGDRLVAVLARSQLAPPSLGEALRESGATAEEVAHLVRTGRLVRVSDEIAYTAEGYERAVQLVREIVARDGSVTVASLRDATRGSRRPMLALLEHLDAERVTRRIGDARVLR